MQVDVAGELRHAGLDPLCVQIDVRNPEQVDEMVERTVKHFGRIDILINNAAGNFVCRAEELSPNGLNAVIGIVLTGSFYCSRAVGRHMIARGGDPLDAAVAAVTLVELDPTDHSVGRGGYPNEEGVVQLDARAVQDKPFRSLSGGNMQKLILGRVLAAAAHLAQADDPRPARHQPSRDIEPDADGTRLRARRKSCAPFLMSR